ncbi:hypothetical protein LIER_42285 [Lithospermum erythrorhizon]|uniref:Reverse transcriptase n=1 Tax=Lithospermum erythrorhizon TaxID=34254 RepID=A0AAV3RP55_LITER
MTAFKGISKTVEILGKGIPYPITYLSAFKLLKSQNGFHYHPKCQEIGHVNISFADDLFLLSGANKKFMRLIKKVLAEFGSVSGLHPNLKLSVRYLGIPLTTKQLSTSDCRGLIEKIKLKFESWGSKHLSFAGRLMFIKTLVFGVYNYWCQSVFLPV